MQAVKKAICACACVRACVRVCVCLCVREWDEVCEGGVVCVCVCSHTDTLECVYERAELAVGSVFIFNF